MGYVSVRLNAFWHAVPTSLYIFNVFITFIILITLRKPIILQPGV